MTSFAVQLEPRPAPRLAAVAMLAYLGAGAAPWFAHCATPLAVALGLAAAAGLLATLTRIPGPQSRLRSLRLDRGCCLLTFGGHAAQPGRLGSGCRAYPGLVCLDLRTARGRCGWILPRSALPDDSFRRLKALIRLAC